MPTRSPIPRTAEGKRGGNAVSFSVSKTTKTFEKSKEQILTGIDVRRTSLERTVCVRNGHAGVIVEVDLDVTRDDTAESADEVVDLARVRAADGVGDTDTVDTDAVDSLVNREKVNQV